ncbi:hypothetical protein EGT81_01480 [Alcaligenes faecalis]|nr:hypothetical protein EGT81_01480 [Alcaligenes faecalis]
MAMEEVLALNHGVASCCFSQCVLLIRHNRMPSSLTRPAPRPAACCLLPAACCLLPAACNILLDASSRIGHWVQNY